jgi:hypothetical protein
MVPNWYLRVDPDLVDRRGGSLIARFFVKTADMLQAYGELGDLNPVLITFNEMTASLHR